MCDKNILSVTLQTAVIMIVKEFAENNEKFSCHDITRTIREKTTNGEMEIPEVETANSQVRFEISHVKVKALFDELWNTGAFDTSFVLTRNFNGMYFEYEPITTPPPSATTPSTQSTSTASQYGVLGSIPKKGSGVVSPISTTIVGVGTTIPPVNTPLKSCTPSTSTASDQDKADPITTTPRELTIERINKYLINCKAKGVYPTIKQIQSAIKRRNSCFNPTCEVIQNIITNQLMYIIIPDPYVTSKSKVLTNYKSNG